MKKSTFLVGLVTASFIQIGNVQADILYSLANDIQNDVIVVEKTGTCKANPYLLNNSRDHSGTPCAAVTAQCPAGTTMIPPISTCLLMPTTSDATILASLKQAQGSYINDLGKPFDIQRLGSPNTSLKCNTTVNNDNSYFYVENKPNLTMSGYAPFCFFDNSKVGGSGFSQPRYVSSSGLVGMSNGTSISLSELNNAANYQCYTATFKATARCITIPGGLLNKLGIKLK